MSLDVSAGRLHPLGFHAATRGSSSSKAAATRRTETKQLAGTVFNFPGFSSSGVSEAQAANFNVSWEVDLFGRFLTARGTANADLAAARFDYEAARASLAANVADAYIQARG